MSHAFRGKCGLGTISKYTDEIWFKIVKKCRDLFWNLDNYDITQMDCLKLSIKLLI